MWDTWAKGKGYNSLAGYLHFHYEANGMSLEELGKRMEVSRIRVAQLLRKYDIPVRGRGGVR
jgi:hypothetical protein